MTTNLRAPTAFPSPLWGGVRGGGIPEPSWFPPSLSLPHMGGGDANRALAVSSDTERGS
jgi:hypothetical protein